MLPLCVGYRGGFYGCGTVHISQKRKRNFALKLAKRVPAYTVKVVFDVGANTGQTLNRWLEQFPDAHFHAFEPIDAAFHVLRENFGKHPKVELHKLALGASAGMAVMIADGASTANAIIDPKSTVSKPTQEVKVEAGDAFCAGRGIEEISVLKVDAEGHDLAVLKGFARMIEASRIDFIQVEAGVNPLNDLHVDLQAFRDFLEPQGYRLFLISSQYPEPANPAILRRCDLMFVSSKIGARKNQSTKANAETISIKTAQAPR